MTAIIPGRLTPDAFRTAFRRHPAGVVVITLDAARGPAGFTATSLTSLSLHPALLSFGIANTASSWPHLRDARTAVVNFLGAHQEDIARTFATSGIDRFAGDHWHRLPTGEPAITGSNRIRAAISRLIPVGDHHIVVGQVLETELSHESPPLVHHDGTYHSL